MRTLARIAVLSSFCINSAHAWWDGSWADRKELVFRASDINTNQDEFTVLVALDSSRIDYGQLQANGEDLRFVDGDDSTPLDFEIEAWNPGGTSYVWVQVPRINANSTTDSIFMYWNNPGASAGGNAQSSWPSDAQIVYHFDHATPREVISNSQATNASSTRVAGQFGWSRDFNGSSYFNVHTTLDSWLGSTTTVMFWLNTTDNGNNDARRAIALSGDRKGSTSGDDIVYGWLDAAGRIGMRLGNDESISTTQVDDGNWHHIVLQRESGGGEQRVYVDGVLEDTVNGANGSISPNASISSIGLNSGTGGLSDVAINATIDELHIYSVYMTADWSYAQYKSQSDNLIEWCPLIEFYADVDTDGYGSATDTIMACALPPGYTTDATDCDDGNIAINPGANEVCDASDTDEDCNGTADNADASATGQTDWHVDNDSDGFGDASTAIPACDATGGRIADDTDCNDNNADEYPGAVWYADTDGDTYGDNNNTSISCLQPADTSLDNTDCDDSDPAINPTTRWYIDDDGDSYGDPATSLVQCNRPPKGVLNADDCNDTDGNINPDTVWYPDDDGDNFGVPGVTVNSCLQPAGYADNTDDCDDSNAAANPNAQWYVDDDNDGYGATGASLTQCLQPPGYADNNADCDDNNASLNPETTWYHDNDGDNWGDPNDASNQCNQPNNHVSNNGDCDDTDGAVSPDAAEICDGIDNDCDTTIDIGVGSGGTWYADTDNDSFGDPNNTIADCVAPPGYLADNQDCDDTDDTVYPGATDACGDGIDSDCNGTGGPDGDEDGDGLTYVEESAVGGFDCSDDTDGDSVPDAVEYPLGDTDGDGDYNINDSDDDNDGFPTDFEYEANANSDETCPNTDLIPDYLDTDSDGDGLPDFDDGIGDADSDGIPNYRDCDSSGCAGDQDGDGLGNCDENDLGTDGANPDSDGDGIDDLTEVGGNPANPSAIDSDGDTIIDALDPDDDNDGLLTIDEDLDGDGNATNDDHDGDGTPNYLDEDDDDDGLPTWDEDTNQNGDYSDDDLDGDGLPDWLDDYDHDGPLSDPDQDGLTTEDEEIAGTNPFSPDSDGDGIDDATELGDGSGIDSDNDGIIDAQDPDDDGDGIPTSDEGTGDIDGDGIPNYLDDDSDGDGLLDVDEGLADTDCDGIPDWADNLVDATCDAQGGTGPAKITGEGCNCATTSGPSGLGWLFLSALLWRRRTGPSAQR